MRFALSGIYILALSLSLPAQCTIDLQAPINDLTTLVLPVQVEGLINDDLSGSQSLCAVGLHFRHNYVGDVTIELISPAGQIVMLVGVVTDQISPTNLITWDVQFIQCGFPASPDPGFSAQWDNNQSWQFLATYTGSYYPVSGCLEDFDTGSANGIWQLRIIDHDPPQTGVLLGVHLIFCDNSGLSCTVCEADAGVFVPETERVCAGENSAIEVVHTGETPDPAIYGSGFYWSEDGIAVNYATQLATDAFAPGVYTICALSFSRSDSADLFDALSGLTLSEIRDAFDAGVSMCADLTENCLVLQVDALIDTTFRQEEVCAGTGVMIGSQVFNTPGRHTVRLASAGACDSVVVLDLSVILVEARIVQTDTITCADQVVTLDGSTSVAGPMATYQWSTSNGMILGPTNGQTVIIQGGGTYALMVFDRGCTHSRTITAITDGTVPFLSVMPGVITCAQPTFTFHPVVFPINVQYQWSGPMGFTSVASQPTVSVPGTYMLTITDSQGCSASAIVPVAADTQTVAIIDLLGIDCIAQHATLRAQQGLPGFTFLWTTPIGTFTTQQINATISGQYCVEVTGTNGCIGSTCINYNADYTIPDVTATATPDTLYCSSMILLEGMTSTPGSTYGWFTVGALISTNTTHTVNLPGTYVFQVVAPNQCRASDTVTVVPSPELLPVITFSDTVSCLRDTVLIGIIIPDPFATVMWSGPGLVDTNLLAVRVTAPGIYVVEITSGMDCVQFAEVPVAGNLATVPFTPVLDSITCANPVAELSFVPGGSYASIEWLLPDNTIATDSVLNTALPGVYQLTLIAHNGCRRTIPVPLPSDTLPPLIFISADALGCTDSVQVQLVALDVVDTYVWSGPGGFSSSLPMPFVSEPGTYTLVATGHNGCVATRTLQVMRDVMLPMLTIMGDTLDCIDSMAVLNVSSPDPGVTFAWFNAGIQVGSTGTLVTSLPGEYIAVATADDGCFASDTFFLPPPVIPGVRVMADTITCVRDATLTATSEDPDAVFVWTDSGGVMHPGPVYTTSGGGPVLLTVTGLNGCSMDTMAIVVIDTLAPLAVAVAQQQITCTIHTIDLDGSGSLGGMLSYMWTTSDGMIDAGALTAAPTVTGPGTYILHIEDSTNGCTDADTLVVIRVLDGPPGELHFSIIPECEMFQNGIIFLDSLPGAQYPLLVTINGMPVADAGMIAGLSAGTYMVTVVDSFGCTVDTTIMVSRTGSSNSVSLGEDQVIILGDTAYLEVMIALDPGQVISVQWTGSVPCDTCLSNAVSPVQSGFYGVEVLDIFGCITRDSVRVIVDERPTFFIPNAFSPNGDGINDIVGIAAHPGIERILRFSIFDRWGNVVFHATDFDRLDTGVRWDGTYAGRKLDPAVFVYLVEFRLLTGRIDIQTGTLTLVK